MIVHIEYGIKTVQRSAQACAQPMRDVTLRRLSLAWGHTQADTFLVFGFGGCGIFKPRDCMSVIVALKFGRHLDCATAELPVKFQSDWKSLNLNLSRLL